VTGEVRDRSHQSRLALPEGPGLALQAGCGHFLPALNHAQIVQLAIVNVPAECTAIRHLVEHDTRVRIVDHELTAELQTISKLLFRISRDRSWDAK
jgi:hypothetical protein